MIRDDCKHIERFPGDWSEFWGAMVQHPDELECRIEREEFYEDRGDECPEYEHAIVGDDRW